MKRLLNPWLGHTREVEGQAFEVVAARPVTWPSGRTRTVLTWSSRCAACGGRFTFTTAREPRDEDLRRLCDRHHVTRRDVRRALRRLLADVSSVPDHEKDIGHGR